MISGNSNRNLSSTSFPKSMEDWSQNDKRDFDRIVAVNDQKNFPLEFGQQSER
jgi:hypothetical protein